MSEPDAVKHSLPMISVNGWFRCGSVEVDDFAAKRKWWASGRKGPSPEKKKCPHQHVRDEDLLVYNGVVSVDIDDVSDMDADFDKLVSSGLFGLVMESIGGRGLWAVASYDRDFFGYDKEGWELAQEFLRYKITEMGLKYDDKCKDADRTRFLSYGRRFVSDQCYLRPTEREADAIQKYKASTIMIRATIWSRSRKRPKPCMAFPLPSNLSPPLSPLPAAEPLVMRDSAFFHARFSPNRFFQKKAKNRKIPNKIKAQSNPCKFANWFY